MSRWSGRRGLTLVEVLIAAALAAAAAGLALGTFGALQRTVARSTVSEVARSSASGVAARLGDALRDLNVDDLDLDPEAPAGLSPTASRPFRYRTVVGFDPAAGRALLSPPRSSGRFREVWLEDTTVHLRHDGLAVALAAGITALELTLDRSTEPPTLLIVVLADRRDPVSPGQVVRGAARLRVVLRNGLAEGT